MSLKNYFLHYRLQLTPSDCSTRNREIDNLELCDQKTFPLDRNLVCTGDFEWLKLNRLGWAKVELRKRGITNTKLELLMYTANGNFCFACKEHRSANDDRNGIKSNDGRLLPSIIHSFTVLLPRQWSVQSEWTRKDRKTKKRWLNTRPSVYLYEIKWCNRITGYAFSHPFQSEPGKQSVKSKPGHGANY